MLYRLTFFTFLMLLVPIGTWLIGWQWQGDHQLIAVLDYPLWLITESGSAPYALIPCVLLMLWLMSLTYRHFSWFKMGVICVISVLGTQGIKSVAKFGFEEPRPYVVQMLGQQSEQFYQQPRTARAEQLAAYYQDSEHPIIVQHRMAETGYSFPSGHTMFAVSWLLLFIGFLGNDARPIARISCALMSLWAVAMLVSRLRLGMHYPIDLFVSTLVAWLFHLVLFLWFIPRWASK